ncbi:MAG: hypothetical protein ABIR26_04640 [Ramlibacter sp.]
MIDSRSKAGRMDPQDLSSLAIEYAKNMTSIRGRRVQRLLKREFAGADHVLTVTLESGAAAVLGLSASGAAICATDGTGRQASVFKWLHGADAATETTYDLHKDSLPALSSQSVPLSRFRLQARLRLSMDSVALPARSLVAKVMDALA